MAAFALTAAAQTRFVDQAMAPQSIIVAGGAAALTEAQMWKLVDGK